MGQLPYCRAGPGAHTGAMTELDSLAAGRAALEAGRWEQARAAFAAALAERETPEALDGMGAALWWLGETQASVDHTERAYAEFRRARDAVPAGAAAISLCVTWASNFDNHAVAGGWLARAERVTQGLDPNPLQGWLWLLRGYLEPTRPGPTTSTGAPSSWPGRPGTSTWSCARSATWGCRWSPRAGRPRAWP